MNLLAIVPWSDPAGQHGNGTINTIHSLQIKSVLSQFKEAEQEMD